MTNNEMTSKDIRYIALTSIGTYAIRPDRENISFGRMALPVLIRRIKDADVFERKRAVQTLCDYVFDSKNTACKEFKEVLPVLKDLTKDADSGVRAKVAECLSATAISAAGRRALLQNNLFSETLGLLDDESESVRQAANTVFQRVALSPNGAEALVEAGVTEKLINRIPQEPNYILVVILDTLHFCCVVDAEKALVFRGLEAVIPLLESPCPSIREKAATVVKDLSVEAKGRNKALECNALPPLLDLCHDEDEFVQAKALAAIMMIANATPARFMAIERDAIKKVLPLLHHDDAEIRLNTLKVLTALAEAPPGRKKLLQNITKIVSMMYDEVQEVRRAAKKAVEIVNFTP